MVRRWRGLFAVATIPLMIGLAAAGCGRDGSSTAGSDGSPGRSTTIQADQTWGHIHNLLIEGDDLLLGTHAGLWRQAAGSAPTPVSEDRFDVMGLAGKPDRYLASGHPAADQRGPHDLGLIESIDGGRTWRTISLAGEVDFHKLAAHGDLTIGVTSTGQGLMRSLDGGANWTSVASVTPYGLTIDPAHNGTVLATTREGLVISRDSGSTFTPLRDSPPLVDVAWTTTALYGVSADGLLHRSRNGGTSWEPAGSIGSSPVTMAAAQDRVVVLAGGTVWESVDAGQSFTPRITGLPQGH